MRHIQKHNTTQHNTAQHSMPPSQSHTHTRAYPTTNLFGTSNPTSRGGKGRAVHRPPPWPQAMHAMVASLLTVWSIISFAINSLHQKTENEEVWEMSTDGSRGCCTSIERSSGTSLKWAEEGLVDVSTRIHRSSSGRRSEAGQDASS